MKYLIPYLKKYKTEVIVAPLFKMLEACFDLAVPIIVAAMIDQGIANGDIGFAGGRFGLLVLMAALGLACSFVAQYFAARAAVGTSTGLRRQLMLKIQSLGYTELDKIGSSTLITRITSDVNQVQNGVNLFLRLFLRSPFIVFGAMLMSFVINAKIALIFAGVILVLFIIVFGIMLKTAPLYREVQQRLDGVTEITRESLNGVRVIRAFGREEKQVEKFARINELLLKAQLLAGKVAAVMNPLTYLVINCGIILILHFGGAAVNRGGLLSGDVIALINYINQILVELVKLANLVIVLGKSVSGMGRIEAVLDAEEKMTFGDDTADSDYDEILRFESVSLKYDGAGAESLSDISFAVKRGEKIGIIGGTGSGKTSLINLISRFYDATGGCVRLKGKPITSLPRETVRGTVAVAEQKARLFAGTIRSNLLWGKNNADEAEMLDALKTAQAYDFVAAKPNGLDEEVEQGGANFSGGQKQRLCVARAVLKDADILILDDSTSALDYATEAAMRKAVSALSDDKTVITVSQRAGTVMHSDRIIVLDDGVMVGIGTHEELLTNCEVYAEIYESQFGAEAMA